MVDKSNNKMEEAIQKILKYSSLEEINKLSVEIFGEKVTIVLKYFCPMYSGLMFSVFCKRMIKTTLIVIGTGSIIYVLMKHKYGKQKVDDELINPLKEGLLNSNIKKSIFDYKNDNFDYQKLKKKMKKFLETNKHSISLFGFGMMLGLMI
ncbi:putative integral membrane protein [Cryptosporidium canis]|uniref:Integral membrane protein n=1 Tax=Cryptosporidium canis TaxID=195482 RepID=A0ABQ8PEE2_9CRYT|nr:putative integral membrane protein [Cryptosporidium canis]KAJ1615359.1 putative integral membrane protein [Cryptosporidium canis]